VIGNSPFKGPSDTKNSPLQAAGKGHNLSPQIEAQMPAPVKIHSLSAVLPSEALAEEESLCEGGSNLLRFS